ncbi:MAG: CDP-alcohol phosphatidyltransferase family protein [Candidatus Zixiibacteriota bacterium]
MATIRPGAVPAVPSGWRRRWREVDPRAMDKLPPSSQYLNISVLWIFYYRLVVRLLYAFRVRHEVVTAASIVCGLAAGLVIAITDSYLLLLAAAVLVHGKDLFDACDGALARLTGTGHRLGRFLDTIGDGVAFTAMIAGVAIHAIRAGESTIGIAAWSAAAWLSLFLQCSYFNYYQINYIIRAGGRTASRLNERDETGGGPWLAGLVRLYDWWFGWQDRLMTWWDTRARQWARRRDGSLADRDGWFVDRRLLTLNSALCFGTHAFVLIVCLAANRPTWFLPVVAVGMNAYGMGAVIARQVVFRHGRAD